MSGLEPGTSWFRVEHSAAMPHDPTEGWNQTDFSGPNYTVQWIMRSGGIDSKDPPVQYQASYSVLQLTIVNPAHASYPATCDVITGSKFVGSRYRPPTRLSEVNGTTSDTQGLNLATDGCSWISLLRRRRMTKPTKHGEPAMESFSTTDSDKAYRTRRTCDGKFQYHGQTRRTCDGKFSTTDSDKPTEHGEPAIESFSTTDSDKAYRTRRTCDGKFQYHGQ
ncbi:hypothetical protein Bbelb_211440 [Branchiostoma belcheri]|nr:hypothetical protein Bbelb_211440 [Branchiostoma belcheri]